jgi:hypothetical protein
MAILALLTSFQNFAGVLSTQTNDWSNNERERKGKRVETSLCLDQELYPSLIFSQQKST